MDGGSVVARDENAGRVDSRMWSTVRERCQPSFDASPVSQARREASCSGYSVLAVPPAGIGRVPAPAVSLVRSTFPSRPGGIAPRNTPTDLDPMRSTEPTRKGTEMSQTKRRDVDNRDPLSLTRTARQWLSFTHAHATQVAQLTRRPHDRPTTNRAFQHQTSAHLRSGLTG